MSNEAVTAVAKDNNTIAIYDMMGNPKTTIFVTSGQIIGQPQNTGSQITVTYTEGGQNYMSVYGLPNYNFINKIPLT